MAQLTLALAAGESPLAPDASEPWVTPDQLDGCQTSDDVDLMSVCTVSSQIIYLLSGRKYGVRTETIRPYAGNRACGWGAYIAAAGDSWTWNNTFQDEGEPTWVMLKGPVRELVSVKIDGVTLSTTGYALYDNRKLVRTPDSAGNQTAWPLHQRMDLDDTNLGTFSITYQWGQDVPVGGMLAAQTLACELARYLDNDPESQLADRVTTVARQGVTLTIDPDAFLQDGRTGLRLPDLWIKAVNPNGSKRKPRIMSVESLNPVRNTPPGTGPGYGNSGYGY